MLEDGEVSQIGTTPRSVDSQSACSSERAANHARKGDAQMSEFDFTPVEEDIVYRDGEEWSVVTVLKAKKMTKCKFYFRVADDIGKGTFGMVRDIVTPDGEHYAMKQLEYDPRYKNREVSIMRSLNHPNCIQLFYYYVERDRRTSELTVNLIMELFPLSLSTLLAQCRRHRDEITILHIRLYMYQLLRGVAYMHLQRIAHR